MDTHHTATTTGQPDVIVVGARCAGASTAMLLARQGLDVVIVDRAELPSDTLSTHALSRGGVVQLDRWGLLDEVVASGAPTIRSLTFRFEGGSLIKEIKDRAGVDHLLAPRRHVLDAILLAAAEKAGASVQTGVSVTGTLTDATGRVTGVALRDRDGTSRELHARFVIGADGLRSRIARSVGARTIEDRGPTGTTTYAYVAGLGAEGFEFHLGDRAFAGVFPTHGGEANVWVCTPADAPTLGVGDGVDGFVDLLAGASLGAGGAGPCRSDHLAGPFGHRPPEPRPRSRRTGLGARRRRRLPPRPDHRARDHRRVPRRRAARPAAGAGPARRGLRGRGDGRLRRRPRSLAGTDLRRHLAAGPAPAPRASSSSSRSSSAS